MKITLKKLEATRDADVVLGFHHSPHWTIFATFC